MAKYCFAHHCVCVPCCWCTQALNNNKKKIENEIYWIWIWMLHWMYWMHMMDGKRIKNDIMFQYTRSLSYLPLYREDSISGFNSFASSSCSVDRFYFASCKIKWKMLLKWYALCVCGHWAFLLVLFFFCGDSMLILVAASMKAIEFIFSIFHFCSFKSMWERVGCIWLRVCGTGTRAKNDFYQNPNALVVNLLQAYFPAPYSMALHLLLRNS